MLNLTIRITGRGCRGGTHRNFLKVGTAGLAGLTLPQLLAHKARAAGGTKSQSVVLLFLCGGASQFETFDHKSGPLSVSLINSIISSEFEQTTDF